MRIKNLGKSFNVIGEVTNRLKEAQGKFDPVNIIGDDAAYKKELYDIAKEYDKMTIKMALSNKNLRDNAIKLTEDQVNILLGNSKISDKGKNYTAKRVANTSSSIGKIETSTSDNGITDAVHRMVVNNQKLTNIVDNESLAKNTSQLKENTSTLKENTIAKEENANAQKDDISSRVSAMASRGETLTNPESIRKSTTDISKTMTELDQAGMKLMHEHEENFSHVSDIVSDLAKTDEKLMHEHEETFANVSDIVSEIARNNEVLMRDSALDPELSSSTAQFDSNTASIERNTQAKLENKAVTDAQKNAVEQETIAQTTNTTSQSGGDISSRVHELAINGGSLVGNDKEQIKDISATVSELNQSGIKLMQEHEDYSVAMANIISELDQNGQKLMTEHEVPNFGNVAQTVPNVEQALTSTATKADDVATKVSELAKNNEVLMKDVAEVGTTTAASVSKVASETSKFGIFMSSLGSEITGLFTGAAGALNAVFAWVGVISLVATGIYKIYDALTLTVDEAEEARNKAVSDLSEAQSNLESINSELETTQQRIDELNGKDKLTFTEQGELEDLKEKNKLLQLQADAAERIQKSKQQDLLNTDSENFDKLYANNISEKNVKETKNYYKDSINALDPKETDISGQIAQLELLQDQYTKLSKKEKEYNDQYGKKNGAEYLADDMNSAKESIDNVTSSLNKQLETLINMKSDYQAVGYENLTDKQKNEYSQIENAIKLIYKSLDPGKYNEISVDDIFNTKDIEATKDDLIELAQAGKLDEKTLNQYPKLTKAIKDADLIAKDGTNATKAFINAIIALGDASEDIEANETNETTISLADINKTKSGIGGLFDKYEQNEGYLTQDEVASVLETNPEYIQYLVKVGDQYKLNEQALNDWNEANKEQEQEINNQMGGNDYLGNYSSLLDSIQDNASHPNGGVGNTNIGSQLDDLINKNKEWNTSLQNGEITTAQYFQNMSNAITDSGLEDALHSLNGTFDDSTDYIEETVSVLATQLSDGLTQSTKRFEEGQTSVKDYIQEINAGSDAEKKLLASTYNLDISQETGKASLDGLSDSALEAAQSYNSLVDSQNALASTSGFVDVLSQNADFLSQYTDEAGNLMDSIFDDSRFNDYVSNMSNSIVDFANQNADTMDQTASWLADTAGISVEQASSIIAQGGDAVQGAVGNSLSGVQSMTSYAMSQVGSATSNAASAVGNVLTSLGNMISNFSYKITAKPFMQGKSKMAWDPKKGLDVSLPTFGFDISGSGGKSVSAFATSIKNAGSAISKYGASQSASAAFNNINSYKPKNTLSANKPSSYRPTYKPKSSGKSGSGGSGGSGGKNSGGDAEKQNEEYLDKFMAYQKALLEAGKITYQQYSQYVSDELERMYKNGKISANKYYSAVKDMIDEQKSIYDAALKGVTKLLDDEIDKWKDKIDVIEKNNDKLNEQKDKYDSILSAIQKVYDDEIKKANKKKDSIQDVIDAMSDENDEYERQKKLQEAIYNLNKANSQKTKYLLKDGQFVYSTDNSAIRDAQDSLHDAQYDVDVANLKKQQDDIDNYIDTLNEFKDKWNEISDAFSDAQDAMNLKQYLGSEYQRIILSNNLADIENFKNQYVAIESQINSNEQLKTSYEEKVDYYNNLKQQWEDCTSKYDDEKNKLYASQILGANWEAEVLSGRQQTLANFTSEYEKLCQRQADATVNAYNTEVQAAKNAAAGIASVSSSVASSGGGSSSGGSSGGSSSSTHKVTYDKNNNPNKPALKSNDYWTYEKLSKKGYSTSGQASSHISDYASKGANGFTQIGNKYFIVKWIANAGSPANASKAKNKLEKDNPKKKGKYGYAKRYHKGLELGKIEALPKDKAFDLVQDIGTNGLEADEVPIIAKKGEAVITEEQIENLAKTLHLVPVQNEIMEKMSKISLGDLPMNTPKMNFDASKVGQNVTRNNFAPSVTLNLNCPNVSSVSDAKAITNVVDKQLNKFANDFYQASLHYINRK